MGLPKHKAGTSTQVCEWRMVVLVVCVPASSPESKSGNASPAQWDGVGGGAFEREGQIMSVEPS